jgi:hypothetical protein
MDNNISETPCRDITDPTSFKDVAPRLNRLGYRPVPLEVGSKGPRLKKWPDYKYSPGDEKKHKGTGCGILCGEIVGLDMDIPDASLLASIVQSIEAILDNFDEAPERIGAAPKTLRVFRTNEPFRKKHTGDYYFPSGLKVAVEILGNGQQLAAFHIHPGTEQPYHWPNDSILDIPACDLPTLDEGNAEKIIEVCKRVKCCVHQLRPPPIADIPFRRHNVRVSGLILHLTVRLTTNNGTCCPGSLE